jgi:hypothetical protein
MTTTPPISHASKASPAPEKEPSRGFSWALTDHCCRVCFSRVLVRETFDRRRVYRCAGCGVEQEGRSEAAICACGIKLKTGVDAGIRCEVSASRSPEFPAEITASQKQAPKLVTS